MLRIIVLNYKRPENVDAICKALHKNFPITVVNNNPNTAYTSKYKNVTVVQNNKNMFCMDRWIKCYDYPEKFKLILDDDFLPSPLLIKKMMLLNTPIVGIYGKTGVAKAESYLQLKDCYLKNDRVDFLVGSVMLVKQKVLDKVKDSIMRYEGIDRGDDIIVSYLIKNYTKTKDLPVVTGAVLQLPEGDVGLNKHPEHFNKRWNVLQKCLS